MQLNKTSKKKRRLVLKNKRFGRARRIVKKNIFKLPYGIANLYLNRSFTNIFITLTDIENNVIISRSSGQTIKAYEPNPEDPNATNYKLVHSKRPKVVPQAIEAIMKAISRYFKLYHIRKVHIILKIKFNVLFSYLLKELKFYGIQVLSFTISRPIAFNGVARKKMRRV